MAQFRLLGISGSLRANAANTKLVHEAARLFEPEEFTFANLRLPLYDGDVEAGDGIPAQVQTLADQIRAADAVVISTPEYNASLSGVLKNALDWVSRTEGHPWLKKPVALMSAAAGRAGGARANYALRLAMAPFRTRLLQSEVLIAAAGREFDGDGRLVSDRYIANVTAQMADLRSEAARA